MIDSGSFRSRIVSGFIVLCIAIVAASMAYAAGNFWVLPPYGEIVVGVALFVAFYLLHGQRINRRKIDRLSYYAGAPSDIEEGLIRRIDELAKQVQAANSAANENHALKSTIEETRRALIAVSDQVEELAGRVESPEKNDGTVVPLHNSNDQDTRATGRDSSRSYRRILDNIADHDPNTAVTNNLADMPVANGTEDLMAHAKNRTLAERLHAAVEHDELELHLQPVVNLGDREPAYYESTLQLKDNDGSYVDQQRLKRLAGREDLATTLDGQLLFSAVRILRTLNELNKRTGLFCPLSQATLENADAFEETEAFLAANIALSDLLVLEIDQSVLDDLLPDHSARLANIADLGFSLLLNNVQEFDFDGKLLHSAGFRFLKVPVDELLSIAGDNNIDEYVTDFSEEMENCGITVIVSDIDQETQVIHLIDFDLPLGQGTLFAPSRPVKPELLKASDENTFMSGTNLA